MARSSRRMRRAAVRALRPEVREIAPGVYDVALPIPPGMLPDEVQAALERFRQTVLVDLGIELRVPRVK